MTTYYNEFEKYPVRWLKSLARKGHIAPGIVDGRSILEVDPRDIGEGQAHFFAGIGIWSCALRMAGVPDDFPVWTGSCPCQPFSVAGRGKGTDDDRHLWPVWRELIRAKMPTVLFGEQVASPAGRKWFASVQADLEALGYRVAAADLCAAGVGAPHIRQRLFFGAVRVGDADEERTGRDSRAGDGAQAEGERARGENGSERDSFGASGPVSRVDDPNKARLERHRPSEAEERRPGTPRHGRSSSVHSAWEPVEYALCSDGRARPLEPGTLPMVDGYPGRVDEIKAYGNAIVPQVAATFIASFLESI